MTRSAIIAGPRGWSPATISKRFASAPGPSSYDAESHTCDAVLSMGTRVKRFYGTEVLRIDPQSVIIERMVGAGIPLLDSHNQSGISSALGRVTRVWFSGGALM